MIASFVPQVKPLNEGLRTVPGAKMLMDVVQINDAVGATQLRKAVQFVCGNTLVCETIKEAKSAAFDRRERNKVNSHHTQIQQPFLIRNVNVRVLMACLRFA